MYGDDKIVGIERGYLRGQVIKIGRWDDAGFEVDARSHLLQVITEIVKAKAWS